METDLHKQTKLTKNFKAAANFFNFLSFKKKKKKNRNKSGKLYLYYSTQKYDYSITTYFPFSKGKFQKKIECCVYIMRVEFSGIFPDYAMFICKFKIDKCFLITKRFQFTI